MSRSSQRRRLTGWITAHGQGRVGLTVHGRWGRGNWCRRRHSASRRPTAPSAPSRSTISTTTRGRPSRAGWPTPTRQLVMHDANGPMLALARTGSRWGSPAFDTALAAYLIRPDQRSYDLADLAVRWLHRDLAPAEDDGQLSLDTGAGRVRCPGHRRPGAGHARPRCGAGARAVAEIGAERLLHEVELPLTGLLVGMERAGIAVDTDALDALRAEFAAEVKRAAEAAYGVDRARGEPRVAQAAAGGAVRRARHAQDEAHQDRATRPMPRR